MKKPWHVLRKVYVSIIVKKRQKDRPSIFRAGAAESREFMRLSLINRILKNAEKLLRVIVMGESFWFRKAAGMKQ